METLAPVTGLKVGDVMSKPVVAVRAEATVREAAQVMTGHSVSGLLVTDAKGRGIGVLTASDIVAYETARHDHVVSEREHERLETEARRRIGGACQIEHADDDRVRDVMTPGIVTVPPGETVAQVAWLMSQKRIHRAFVERKGRIVGVVASSDVVRAVGRIGGPCRSLK